MKYLMPKGHYHTDPTIDVFNGKRFLCHGQNCKGTIFLSMYEARKAEQEENYLDFLNLVEGVKY